MVAVGTKPHHARSLAEVLVEGDHRGHYSHGLNRMGEWAPLRSSGHLRRAEEIMFETGSRRGGSLTFDLFLSDMYVKDIESGICAKEGEPVVEKESAATALVDGKNLLGPVVGNFCMDLAIKKAREVGIGWVVAHGGFALFQSLRRKVTANCSRKNTTENSLFPDFPVKVPTIMESLDTMQCWLWRRTWL